MPGAATAQLDLLPVVTEVQMTYRRTNITKPSRSFPIIFSPSRLTSRLKVIQHTASHVSAVPDLIGYHIRALLQEVHTVLTQPPSLGMPEATTILHLSVCDCNIFLIEFKHFPNFSRLTLSPSFFCNTSYDPLAIRQLFFRTIYLSAASAAQLFNSSVSQSVPSPLNLTHLVADGCAPLSPEGRIELGCSTSLSLVTYSP